MNARTTGWLLLIAAVGMMSGLMAADIGSLRSWHDAMSPAFIGLMMGHLSTVVMAFVGGKIIPVDRDPGERGRATD